MGVVTFSPRALAGKLELTIRRYWNVEWLDDQWQINDLKKHIPSNESRVALIPAYTEDMNPGLSGLVPSEPSFDSVFPSVFHYAQTHVRIGIQAGAYVCCFAFTHPVSGLVCYGAPTGLPRIDRIKVKPLYTGKQFQVTNVRARHQLDRSAA